MGAARDGYAAGVRAAVTTPDPQNDPAFIEAFQKGYRETIARKGWQHGNRRAHDDVDAAEKANRFDLAPRSARVQRGIDGTLSCRIGGGKC